MDAGMNAAYGRYFMIEWEAFELGEDADAHVFSAGLMYWF
jgi:hypothetical protein